jgi:hypothetical protein
MEEWKAEIRRLWTMRMDDSDYLKALVESMPRRLAEVIEREAATTKYILTMLYLENKQFFADFVLFFWLFKPNFSLDRSIWHSPTVSMLFNPSPHGPFRLLHLTAKGYIWP